MATTSTSRIPGDNWEWHVKHCVKSQGGGNATFFFWFGTSNRKTRRSNPKSVAASWCQDWPWQDLQRHGYRGLLWVARPGTVTDPRFVQNILESSQVCVFLCQQLWYPQKDLCKLPTEHQWNISCSLWNHCCTGGVPLHVWRWRLEPQPWSTPALAIETQVGPSTWGWFTWEVGDMSLETNLWWSESGSCKASIWGELRGERPLQWKCVGSPHHGCDLSAFAAGWRLSGDWTRMDYGNLQLQVLSSLILKSETGVFKWLTGVECLQYQALCNGLSSQRIARSIFRWEHQETHFTGWHQDETNVVRKKLHDVIAEQANHLI